VLEVYTWEPNANAGKPLLCLKEKGVEFVYHYVDIGRREQHSPEYLKINPNGTVPALVHDGVVFTESTPAMEYIDEAFEGPALRPRDPYLLWRAIDRVPLPERKRSWSMQMFNRLPKEELAESARRVDAAVGAYETALAEYPYLAGPEYSLADINAMCTIYALPLQRPEQVNRERTPHFMDWYRRCHERPAIQAAFEMGHDWVAGRVREMRRQLGIET
jgi:GST-like protein